jgi:hypothetical protein
MHEGALWEYVKKALVAAHCLAKGRPNGGLGLGAQRSAAATLVMGAANRWGTNRCQPGSKELPENRV